MSNDDPLARLRAARGNDELAVLEGFHAVKHALRFGAELLEVLAVDPVELERLAAQLAPDVGAQLAARARRIGAEDLEALTAVHVPGEVVALARRPRVDVPALLTAPGPGPVVLLDSPRHLGNVGAAIRVAAAAQAEALVVTGTSDPWHPAAIRGAAGLQFALPVGRLASAAGLPRPLVALDPAGEPLRADLVPPGAVLAFGAERHGLSEEARAAAVATLALPMRDGVSSLNLAAAVAAVLYGLRLTR
jgi:TrmH family RNA methyltransferase